MTLFKLTKSAVTMPDLHYNIIMALWIQDIMKYIIVYCAFCLLFDKYSQNLSVSRWRESLNTTVQTGTDSCEKKIYAECIFLFNGG